MTPKGAKCSRTAKFATIFAAVASVGIGLTACGSGLESQNPKNDIIRQAGALDIDEQLRSRKVTKLDGDINPLRAQTLMRLEEERRVLSEESQTIYNQLGTLDKSEYNLDTPFPRNYRTLAYYQRLAKSQPEIRELVDRLTSLDAKIQKVDHQINSNVGSSEH